MDTARPIAPRRQAPPQPPAGLVRSLSLFRPGSWSIFAAQLTALVGVLTYAGWSTPQQWRAAQPIPPNDPSLIWPLAAIAGNLIAVLGGLCFSAAGLHLWWQARHQEHAETALTHPPARRRSPNHRTQTTAPTPRRGTTPSSWSCSPTGSTPSTTTLTTPRHPAVATGRGPPGTDNHNRR
jgi:hypothetical protein